MQTFAIIAAFWLFHIAAFFWWLMWAPLVEHKWNWSREE